MRTKILLMLSALALNGSALADVKCGNFILTSSNDGFMHINGMRPESQKFTFLGQKNDYDNVKYEWMVATNQPGNWLGMEYIKRNGSKRILNIQVVQAKMDVPQSFATYDCIKIG